MACSLLHCCWFVYLTDSENDLFRSQVGGQIALFKPGEAPVAHMEYARADDIGVARIHQFALRLSALAPHEGKLHPEMDIVPPYGQYRIL